MCGFRMIGFLQCSGPLWTVASIHLIDHCTSYSSPILRVFLQNQGCKMVLLPNRSATFFESLREYFNWVGAMRSADKAMAATETTFNIWSVEFSDTFWMAVGDIRANNCVSINMPATHKPREQPHAEVQE
eukprot:m.97194 g.97194  ORF g.97194 m.97194 type:complete len:130 (+) comp16693_c0_seq2:402-791(+)